MTDKALMERIVRFRTKAENQSPFGLYLGLEIIDIDKGEATLAVPYAKHLAAACGLSVIAALGEPTTIATLDLRIDYLKPASPEETVFAYGHCYKVTKNVCFVRGIAYQKDKAKPIANATATFMITAKGTGRQVQKNAQPLPAAGGPTK